MLKRTFDIAAATVGILVTFPVLVVTGVLVALFSKGPIIFKQVRVGKEGRHFQIYKFRTMAQDAQDSGAISAGKDPRVTRIGVLLRVTKLDELPQLFNVLKGDMSVIGPRPEVPEIVKHYTEDQRRVLSVKPGIIGPAQIAGRNESDMLPKDLESAEEYYIKNILPDKLKIDLKYVQNGSLLGDLRLLIKGIVATIMGLIRPATLQGKTGGPLLFVIDLLLILISYSLAYCLRFDWDVPSNEIHTFLYSLPVVFFVRFVLFYVFKLYHSFYKYISIRDLLQIVKACSASAAVIVIAIFFVGARVHSRSIFVIDWLILMLSMSGVRVVLRLLGERQVSKNYMPVDNVLIVGAGDIGEMLTREISKNGQHFRVVGFVDDDPKKIGSSIRGVKVYGDRTAIPHLTNILHVDEVFIASDSISPQQMHSILSYCKKAEVKHHIVPAVTDLVSGKIQLSKMREVNVSDLLGRKPLELNLQAIKDLIVGKRILVTGAGGSIGSELCRQVFRYGPERVVLIDRNENYLYELEHQLNGDKNGVRLYSRVIDVRDARKMERIFAEHQPQIVFHAAAQKHVPLSETNVDEAVSNNVWGTRVAALLSEKYNVERFILISTDKAVNPTSVMGVTKRVAELHTQAIAKRSHTKFVTVRFGNVLNSNGSVVPLFMKQIEKGGPVTVTHPNIERYFMSITEAVQLVIQAATMGKGGDVFVLDMGERIKITDLACELIERAGLHPHEDIAIKFTGLRRGEKLIEELIGPGEMARQTQHRRIQVLHATRSFDAANLERKIRSLCQAVSEADDNLLRKKLKAIVPEFSASVDESHLAKEQISFGLATLESTTADSLAPAIT